MGLLLSIIALIGGTIHTGQGEPQTGAVILVEGGVITALGEDVPIPPTAERIQIGDGWITPGFIDPFTQLGLVEIGGVAASNDTFASLPYPVRSAQRAIDSLNPHSSLTDSARSRCDRSDDRDRWRGNLRSAAAISLGTGRVIKAPVAFVTRFGGRSEGNRGQTVAFLRALFDDVRAYRLNRDAFMANRFRPLVVHRLDLEALEPLIDGDVPLFVRADRRSDILVALRFAQEQGISITLVGAREGWLFETNDREVV